MQLNEFGKIVQLCWNDLPNHYNNIELDAFVVMPNHIHAIIVIRYGDAVGAGFKPARNNNRTQTRAGLKPAPTNTKCHGLPEIVRAFKTFSSKRINKLQKSPGEPFWQRNYYEHVVRNECDLDEIRKYIVNNPAKWKIDKYYSNQRD
jgi:REP element-mobilizing transposase RayT